MKAAGVCAAAFCCAIAGMMAVAVAADPMAYGRHLSGECVTCHKLDGTDTGIPSITGWDKDEFVQTLKYYKEGLRDNPAMRSVAESLDDTQMDALATYFGSLPKPPRRTSNTK